MAVRPSSEGVAGDSTEEGRREEHVTVREAVREGTERNEDRIVLAPFPPPPFANAHLEERVESGGGGSVPLPSSGGKEDIATDVIPVSRSTVVRPCIPHARLLPRAPSRSTFFSSLPASEAAEPAKDAEDEEEEEVSEKREANTVVLARDAEDKSSN